MGFVVGLDAGGTATRALVFDLDGTRLGAGVAGGANPHSHPPERAARHVGEALRMALDGLDAGKVESGVLGMAGSSRLGDPEVEALFTAAWNSAGLRCPMRVITDCEAAFASGSAAPDGTVLVAGTGSISARIVDHRLVSAGGGYGWLLGDEGSAFWIGREAVRATLREVARPGPLARAVLAHAGVTSGDRRRALIVAANAGAPVRLAEFAPLVTANAHDPVADDIIASAVEHLVDLALADRGRDELTPLVLIGSLVHATAIGPRLRRALATRTSAPIHVASGAAAGAAWLAAVSLLGESAPRLR
ncbi:BadF/BadG/BcrA/BcrD ATPase family protein [Saccharothrix violaceirubra]|uniref:N-acetylglucosamine kinase-like BadF-type ATPase n=1 Tax=Saccharothrix violaceirubra TaxID=413306 RepID=A0A7W7TBL9_9PSEU|nr:BadF/BadG/BcrA/BcrD ATPase family protein [Saccharothrix violaceirubra]MBB4968820.1 N-acetylglucosamine kinase-like BadF-type ATPase [Saccharothrix violaceirubra]